MSRIVDIEPLLHKYDRMNEGTEFSPIHFINDLMAFELQPCEDCISLNKLDDIITKAIDESENQTECQTLRWVLDVMSELPSVTPKTVTDFADKCKECGKILNDKLKTKWIPVSERLPEDGTWNIWQSKTGALSIERYKEDAYNHFYPSGRFFSLEDAVAWMPLPQPYKESEDSK